ncbi:hypothetical protein EYF80_026689 [Liparis tanakae]|uniref:Uncharacterized protein n=1 Tax=Liparis tanakae TaxID=230148 RepID=A0A4Z2HDH0_9TELE|nr:hypothetical protein EYF80_026689 [Liparis tanakae]
MRRRKRAEVERKIQRWMEDGRHGDTDQQEDKRGAFSQKVGMIRLIEDAANITRFCSTRQNLFKIKALHRLYSHFSRTSNRSVGGLLFYISHRLPSCRRHIFCKNGVICQQPIKSHVNLSKRSTKYC